MQSLKALLNSILSPPPPPPLAERYGFRWQLNGAVPATFQGFNVATAAPGIYVTFRPNLLQADIPLFGNGGTQVPLYALPPAPSQGLTNITTTIIQQSNPDQGLFVTTPFLRGLQGYLDYTNRCLNYIALTATGLQLLNRINQSQFSVFIDPGAAGNGIQVNNSDNSLTRISLQLIQSFNNLNVPQINQMLVDAIPGDTLIARLNQLATDINAMPLYSEFLQENAYTATFLQTNLRYNGAVVNGNDLRNWLMPGDGGAFFNFLRDDNTLVNSVRLVRYLRLAVIIRLYSVSPAGAGSGSAIYFNIRRDTADPLDLNTTRPPAIGLAHELIHAMHNAYGTQPGLQINDYSTVLAELLAVGLGPFNTAPISENAIRAQWAAIAGNTDATNNMAAPRRTIYDDPAQSHMTVDAIRLAARTY
jgi:Effector protein